MREVLTTMVEICPLSYRQKKRTTRYLNRMPEWLMASWAESLNIDYMGGRSLYPDMAEQAKGDAVAACIPTWPNRPRVMPSEN